MKGDFARSKAGHDKDKLYVIIDEDNTFVYLSDGNLRKIENPKKKKKKHVQLIYNKEMSDIEYQNESIKRAIKLYKED